MLLFPVGFTAGLLLAWRWEMCGALVSIGSMAGFYAVHALLSRRAPRGPYFALLTVPAVLFLVYSLLPTG